jgi:HEAT repeat protein
MTTLEVESLFARTVVGDYESKDAWDAVRTLSLNGSREIFELAKAWCSSEDPRKRRRAANILCQLRRGTLPRPEFLFRGESYVLLTNMLAKEQDLKVLDSTICGLGHLGNELAIPLVLPYQDHAQRNIRLAVSFALGCFPDDSRSVEGLLKLTADPEADIRDWSIFALGVLGTTDSTAIREALLRCLEDTDEEVREEAAVGLGKRRDKRLIPALQNMLEEPGLKVRVAEAAAALLGMDQDPPDWTAADYRAALAKIGE